MVKNIITLILILLLGFACTKEESGDGTPIIDNPQDTMMIDTGMNTNEYLGQIPIIMLHGTLGSGDTYATQFYRFLDNGYKNSELYVFDWDGASFGNRPLNELDDFVNEVLESTGAPKVNLVGHSAGGGFCFDYLSEMANAEKVAMYAHVAGTEITSIPQNSEGTIPTLNLYSTDDQTVAGSDVLGANNVSLNGLDHYEIATSAESFEELYSFFQNGNPPEFSDFQEQDNIILEGKVLTLGDNAPNEGIAVDIYPLNNTNGERETLNPVASFISEEDGFWGPFNAEKNKKYEFEINSEDPAFKTVHYYREGFTHSDGLVYLRSFPQANSVAGLLLGNLPNDDAQSVVAVFSSSSAIIDTRDVLDFDGNLLSNPELTSSNQTTIALFLYDDGDGISSGTAHGAFSFVPFLNGADYWINTSQVEHLPVTLNDKSLYVRNWKSESEGYSVLIFN